MNFIHSGHLVNAAEVYTLERAIAIPHEQCYPRFPVLGYTMIVHVLRDSEKRPPEHYDALIQLWEALQADRDFDSNFDLVKEVRNMFLQNKSKK